jgi:hypothetical protein
MCLERDYLLRPNASDLLQSPFINNAILRKVVFPSIPSSLKPDFEVPPSTFDLESLITSILIWQPEHIDEIVFLAPHINLDSILIKASPSAQRAMQKEYGIGKEGKDIQDKRIFSRKAINHLALELSVHPDKILEIIISNHIKKPKHDSNNKQSVSRKTSNPLYPYEYG